MRITWVIAAAGSSAGEGYGNIKAARGSKKKRKEKIKRVKVASLEHYIDTSLLTNTDVHCLKAGVQAPFL